MKDILQLLLGDLFHKHLIVLLLHKMREMYGHLNNLLNSDSLFLVENVFKIRDSVFGYIIKQGGKITRMPYNTPYSVYSIFVI